MGQKVWAKAGHLSVRTAGREMATSSELPPPSPLPPAPAGPGLPTMLAVYRHKGLCILRAGDSPSRKSFLHCTPGFPK